MFTIQIGEEHLPLTYDNFVLACDDEEQATHRDIVSALRLLLLDTIKAFSRETLEQSTLALAKSLYMIALNMDNPEPLAIVLSHFAVRFAFEHFK